MCWEIIFNSTKTFCPPCKLVTNWWAHVFTFQLKFDAKFNWRFPISCVSVPSEPQEENICFIYLKISYCCFISDSPLSVETCGQVIVDNTFNLRLINRVQDNSYAKQPDGSEHDPDSYLHLTPHLFLSSLSWINKSDRSGRMSVPLSPPALLCQLWVLPSEASLWEATPCAAMTMLFLAKCILLLGHGAGQRDNDSRRLVATWFSHLKGVVSDCSYFSFLVNHFFPNRLFTQH